MCQALGPPGRIIRRSVRELSPSRRSSVVSRGRKTQRMTIPRPLSARERRAVLRSSLNLPLGYIRAAVAAAPQRPYPGRYIVGGGPGAREFVGST